MLQELWRKHKRSQHPLTPRVNGVQFKCQSHKNSHNKGIIYCWSPFPVEINSIFWSDIFITLSLCRRSIRQMCHWLADVRDFNTFKPPMNQHKNELPTWSWGRAKPSAADHCLDYLSRQSTGPIYVKHGFL
jgi:hypothetical protein